MRRIIFLFLILLGTNVCISQETIHLKNEKYQISIPEKFEKGSLITIEIIGYKKIKRSLSPEITIIYSKENPEYHSGHLAIGNSPVAAWKNASNETELNIWELNEIDVLKAGYIDSITEEKVSFKCFHPKGFVVNLKIELEAGDSSPRFSYDFESPKDGWYSFGFTGIQSIEPENLDFLYQPMVWSWKRFPVKPVITPESMATTAAVFTNYNEITEGVAPDLTEIPFRFATFKNSRFGFALRTNKGMAVPMLFAPVFGGAESFMKKGGKYNFGFRYFLQEGDWMEGIDFLYKDILKYKTERQNACVTLNQTLENMIDLAMDDCYSGWIEELKAHDYRFDVPGTVKNVSALHPLSIALTTGNMEIYRRRALPMIEYMLSREKYLYAINDSIKAQNPSHFMNGPCMEIAELASLHQFTKGASKVFEKETERIFGVSRKLNLVTETGGASWQDYLAKYRISNNSDHLKQSMKLAEKHIQETTINYPNNFSTSAGLKDMQATFVTDYSNSWYDLMELFEETGVRKFLDAAIIGARQMLLWIRSNPLAPDSIIIANEGNKVAGVFPGRRFKANSYEFKEYDTTTEIQEQKVPAWRTSFVGLPPEVPYTYRYGPIMLTHHAAWMLRLAYLSGDKKFKDAAYNAVIGRYANFPGYYFTSMRTTVYQQYDYPLKSYFNVKYNALFYNHIWPHIALLQDFLVSDAYLKSNGKVNFPSAYSPGYAFLTSKVYGHKKGEIFGNKNLSLWLPKDALKTSCIEINHLFARDEQNTYLVLINTSNKPILADIYLNSDVINWDYNHQYSTEIWSSENFSTTGQIINGKVKAKVPIEGVVAIKIKGLKNDVPFQDENATLNPTEKADNYYRQEHANALLGTITGMLINVSGSFTDAYVYSTATEKETDEVVLNYQIGENNWMQLTDKSYPFEFSIHLDNPNEEIKLVWSAKGTGSEIAKSNQFILKN